MNELANLSLEFMVWILRVAIVGMIYLFVWRIFRTMMGYVLAHEAAHFVLGHVRDAYAALGLDASDSIVRDIHLLGKLYESRQMETDADTLLVVAHNPGVHALVLRLLHYGSAPPSVAARFDRGYPTSRF